jgi:hypothetical protein
MRFWADFTCTVTAFTRHVPKLRHFHYNPVQMFLLEGDKLLRLESFGEDTCELVSTIEHSFGIKFTQDELIHAKTLGAMAQTIYSKLEHPVGPQCLSAITFYKLRRAFVELFGARRAEISPVTSLYELMPWNTRNKQWRDIQGYLNYALPQLGWPLWLLGFALLLTGSILYVLFNFKVLWTMAAASVLVGIVGFISVLVPVCVILNPLAREFPRGCVTFGDLTKLVLARNYGNIAAKRGRSSENELMQALLQLVAAETAGDLEKLSSDTRFPEDLGIY